MNKFKTQKLELFFLIKITQSSLLNLSRHVGIQLLPSQQSLIMWVGADGKCSSKHCGGGGNKTLDKPALIKVDKLMQKFSLLLKICICSQI